MSTTVTSHVEIDDEGVAWITAANTKVIEVVLDKLTYGWSPEEIHREHPHLTLAQIHSALAYYDENQEKLDAEIARRGRKAEDLARQAADPALRRSFSTSSAAVERPPLHGRPHPVRHYNPIASAWY